MARSSRMSGLAVDIDALLTEAARNGVASFRSEERSFADVLINVHHDAAGRQVVIDVLRGYRPDHPGAEMEDFEQWVGNSVRVLTEKFSPAPQIVFLYGGKSFEALFPLQARRMDAVRHHSLRRGGPGAAIPAGSGGDAGRGKSPHAPATDSELDALLTREALRVLRRLQPLEGQRIGGPVRASMDVDTGAITVYFPRDFLPADPEGGFEDQLDNFRHAALPSLTLQACSIAMGEGTSTLIFRDSSGKTKLPDWAVAASESCGNLLTLALKRKCGRNERPPYRRSNP
ncbi:hypothetical protein ABRP17_000380 [Stenotrophomonas sp. WHRI 8082]|uniref:hypothetical protein n=1 Tax=Stenotrophomonas sp. WHRI 8082 TaxID=3162571 RepID=UPI0032ECDDD9